MLGALKFVLLQFCIGGHAGLSVAARQIEHAQVQGMEAGQCHELKLVAHGPELSLESGNGGLVELSIPMEGR